MRENFHELFRSLSGKFLSVDDVIPGWSSESQLKQRCCAMEDCPNNPCC